MKENYKRYGFNVSAFLLGAILVLLIFKRCGNGGGSKPVSDTISIRVDTVYAHVKVDTHYIPKPYKVVEPYRVEVPVFSGTYNDTIYLDGGIESLKDTIKALRDYLSTKYYAEVHPVKYGSLTISDTLYRNEITGRGILLDQNIPEVSTTYTIEAQQRTVFYIGGDMYGNANAPIFGIGAAAGIKFRNGKYYEVKALLSKEGVPLYGIGFRLPISLRKK